jgi:hypothetical protein
MGLQYENWPREGDAQRHMLVESSDTVIPSRIHLFSDVDEVLPSLLLIVMSSPWTRSSRLIFHIAARPTGNESLAVHQYFEGSGNFEPPQSFDPTNASYSSCKQS